MMANEQDTIFQVIAQAAVEAARVGGTGHGCAENRKLWYNTEYSTNDRQTHHAVTEIQLGSRG